MSFRPPVWTTRVTTPGANAFAILSGFEAMTRALVAAALPIQTQALFGNDESVSTLVLVGSVAALAIVLFIPKLCMVFGRARLCMLGLLMLAGSTGLFMFQLIPMQVLGFVFRALGSVIFFAVLYVHHGPRAARRDRAIRTAPSLVYWSVLDIWTFDRRET